MGFFGRSGDTNDSPLAAMARLLPWRGGASAREAAQKLKAARAEHARKVLVAGQRRAAIDLKVLARGGIPIQARERLKELGQGGAQANALFTSNLAPDEIALLRRLGFRARGLVTGSCMYHVGQTYASASGDCEVKVLSDAYNAASKLAVSRLEQELTLIGAHGVVGVRFSTVRHEWADKTIEVQVFGTAVEGPGPAPASPWLSDLSGQEFFALHRAGYEPTRLVWGHAAWFVLTTLADELIEARWKNAELTHWSQALSKARHIALNQAQAQANEAASGGVVGVHFDRRLEEVRLSPGRAGSSSDPVYERRHHILMVSLTATAIRLRPDAPAGVTATRPVLSLRDGRLNSTVAGLATQWLD